MQHKITCTIQRRHNREELREYYAAKRPMVVKVEEVPRNKRGNVSRHHSLYRGKNAASVNRRYANA